MANYDEFKIDEFDIKSNFDLLPRERKYPWYALDEVGKGFWIPPHCAIIPVRSSASSQGKRRGMRFRVVKIGDRYACIRVA